MYLIVTSKLDYIDIIYQMFLKSVEIDIGINQKMYAGAYLSLIYGIAELEFEKNEYKLNPHISKEIKGLKFKFSFKNKNYKVEIFKDNSYKVKE